MTNARFPGSHKNIRSGAKSFLLPLCVLPLLASISLAHAATASQLNSGVNLSIPAGAPSLLSFQAATLATVDYSYAPYYGLSQLLDASGVPVTIRTQNGATADAFLDGVGNIIIAFQWDTSPVQGDVATATLSGVLPTSLPAYADALAFTKTVESIATAQGRPLSKIYLNGFSVGGMLASYVATQTGLPGVTFGACGLPGYTASAQPGNNFVNFVEKGDPIAEYGTDTSESGSALAANPHMDHYGYVVELGTDQAAGELAPFATQTTGYSYGEIASGASPFTPDQIAALEAEGTGLQAKYHEMSPYISDSDAFATGYGIDPTQP